MSLSAVSWPRLALLMPAALLSSSLLAQTNGPGRKYSSVERMKTGHLKAAHDRVEGWLKLDGEDRPWIYSNPIYVR